MNEVGRHKPTLTLALDADTMAAILRAISKHKETASGIADLKIFMITSAVTEARRKTVEFFSQYVEPQIYLTSVSGLRQMGTGL